MSDTDTTEPATAASTELIPNRPDPRTQRCVRLKN